MAVDPATIGAAAGAFLMAVGAFIKVFRSESKAKARDADMLETLKVVRDIFGTNGNGGKDGAGKMYKSDGIPGFAPECLTRAKEHGERIATTEGDIRNITLRFAEQDKRFDGLNNKIESVRRDIKADFAELRNEIRERA